MASFMAVVMGLLVIGGFSVLEARAGDKLWRKCRRSDSLRRKQRQITLGKCHLR